MSSYDFNPLLLDALSSTEQNSDLARALHGLVHAPLPPEALPQLGNIAGVIYLESFSEVEVMGDLLGNDRQHHTGRAGVLIGVGA
jgi:hypothetical protein